MPEPFARIVRSLTEGPPGPGELPVELGRWLEAGGPPGLAAAFLVALSGPEHRLAGRARAVFETPPADTDAELRALLVDGIAAISQEIAAREGGDPAFTQILDAAAATVADPGVDPRAATEAAWSVLDPEAVGLLGRVGAAVDALRQRRLVSIEKLNPRPISDAAHEVLFTSNVLLGLPLDAPEHGAHGREPGLEPSVAAAVRRARDAEQLYWFDHPIPIGVTPAANELLHGLEGLDAALAVEPEDEAGQARRLTCLLSVSVTHADLRPIARQYIAGMTGMTTLQHVDVLVATEIDVRRLVAEVIQPAMNRFMPSAVGRTGDDLDVLGVDGEYGRHYSFLKAIAAIWHVFVDPRVRGTFKIDLDQVFPQAELVAQTGRTALEHLATPLWGATGRDSTGRPVELGLLAGALVNAGDIGRGLFTPDVPLPGGPGRPSEQVFFSTLPQAISTRAEMMERYDTARPDGRTTALERIHVTGGTSGILVESLRRHRPFTPSFVGRAEDQAYALSVQGQPGPRLACIHAAGLIMRHDKEAYAGAAIEAAFVGKLVGDDVRILTFSAYARAIAETSAGAATVDSIKALMDPFTGGFISDLPVTTVLLRFALRVIEAHAASQPATGDSYAWLGAQRLVDTLRSTQDGPGFRAQIDAERRQWNALYDTLDAVELALLTGDPAAIELRDRARTLIGGWQLNPGPPG